MSKGRMASGRRQQGVHDQLGRRAVRSAELQAAVDPDQEDVVLGGPHVRDRELLRDVDDGALARDLGGGPGAGVEPVPASGGDVCRDLSAGDELEQGVVFALHGGAARMGVRSRHGVR
jgi:hypothetical protein